MTNLILRASGLLTQPIRVAVARRVSIVAKFARKVVSYAGTVAAAVSSGGSLRIWVSTVRIDRILIAPNIIGQSLARLDSPSQKARRQLQAGFIRRRAPTKLDVKRQTFDTFFWARHSLRCRRE